MRKKNQLSPQTLERPQVFQFTSIYDEPKFVPTKTKDWIDFGHDNLCFDYIDSLLEMSSDHAAIINGTIQYTIGEGLIPPTEPRALAFFKNGSEDKWSSSNLAEITKKLSRDLVVYGAAAINVVWTLDGKGFSDMSYVDVRQIRADKEGRGYWVSTDWKNHKREGNVPRFFASFSNEKRTGSQILYVRQPNARKTPLALPSYWSGREYIECDQELITLSLNRVRNGFFMGALIRFSDIPTPEEQDLNFKSLTSFYGGSSNAGKAAIIYGSGVEISDVKPSDVPADLALLQERVDQKIKRAHLVGKGNLFGLASSDGSVFSTEDLVTEFEIFNRSRIQPIVWTLTDSLDMLSTACGIDHRWEVKPFVLFPKDAITTTAAPEAPIDPNLPSIDG